MTDENNSSFFHMGNGTLRIPMKIHKINRERLCQRLKASSALPTNAVILLQGGSNFNRYDTDTDVSTFRQESFYHWLFGVLEADCYAILEVDDCKATIFVPRLDPSYAIWQGEIFPPEFFLKKYEFDASYFVDEMENVLMTINPSKLLILKGINSDSDTAFKEAHFKGMEKFLINKELLHPIMTDLRVFKTDLEKDVLRYTNKISSEAHKKVMQFMRPGMFEYQGESVFLNHCYCEGGMRHVGYACICAGGQNGAVLHYGHAGAPNNKLIKDGDLCLFDMGGEYYGYTADITCAFPVSGIFSSKQKVIYEAVLRANRAVLAAVKPGVQWIDMHRLAERIILEDLKSAGLLVGDINDMTKVHLASLFMPHGLGHLLGLDVHDVGGYPEGINRINEPGIKCLRTARTLQKDMVLTIEPGCYFIGSQLDEAFDDPQRSKFLVREKLNEFRDFGGVRIEDNIIMTEAGAELLTDVPRTVEEIEEFMGRRTTRV